LIEGLVDNTLDSLGEIVCLVVAWDNYGYENLVTGGAFNALGIRMGVHARRSAFASFTIRVCRGAITRVVFMKRV
jgi:hypothetical protein